MWKLLVTTHVKMNIANAETILLFCCLSFCTRLTVLPLTPPPPPTPMPPY